MAVMQINSNLHLNGALVMAKDEQDFPVNPQVGTMIIKDQVLYAYIKIGGLETWYPFASKTNSYVHVQALAATTWTITHNLGTRDVWTQIKDANGAIVSANVIAINEDQLQVNFTTATTGSLVVVAPDSIDVPIVKSTEVIIGTNSEVVINSGGVMINGSYALTAASIEQQIADAVAAETDRATAVEQSLVAMIGAKANTADVYSRTYIDSMIVNGGSY